jgi:hypothetical protein
MVINVLYIALGRDPIFQNPTNTGQLKHLGGGKTEDKIFNEI